MTIILEIDKQWAGIGVDWLGEIKGIRLGFLAIHFIAAPFYTVLEGLNEAKDSGIN